MGSAPLPGPQIPSLENRSYARRSWLGSATGFPPQPARIETRLGTGAGLGVTKGHLPHSPCSLTGLGWSWGQKGESAGLGCPQKRLQHGAGPWEGGAPVALSSPVP